MELLRCKPLKPAANPWWCSNKIGAGLAAKITLLRLVWSGLRVELRDDGVTCLFVGCPELSTKTTTIASVFPQYSFILVPLPTSLVLH